MSEQPAASPAPTPSPRPPLDVLTLLARLNHRLTLLRLWLGHDHRDEPWWARHRDARDCQREQRGLRAVAHVLHVERATRRGRIHSAQFATLDEQRAWLENRANHECGIDPVFLGLPAKTTLQMIRDGVVAS